MPGRGKQAHGRVAERPIKAANSLRQRVQLIFYRLELGEDVRAKGLVGRGYKAGRIMRRDARAAGDPPARKGDGYRGEAQRAGEAGRTRSGRKRSLAATKEVDP